MGEAITESTMYERMAAIRAEVIELITSVAEPQTRRELHADAILDDLLAIANRLGRLDRRAGERLSNGSPPTAHSQR